MDVFIRPSRLTAVLLLLLSAFLAWMLVVFKWFPYTGIAIASISFAILGFSFQKKKTLEDLAVLVSIIIFSIFLVIRSNILLTFLNSFAIFALLTLFIRKLDFVANIKGFILQPFIVLQDIIQAKNIFSLTDETKSSTPKQSNNQINNALFGILISIILLILIIPLLSFANPIFAKITQDFISFINIEYLIRNLFGKDLFIWVWRLIFFGAIFFLLTQTLSFISSQHTKAPFPDENKSNTPSLLIPKIVVSIILLLFFATQIELYTASPQILSSLDISLSQHTREVFAHLLIVGLIIFALIYNDRSQNKIDRLSTYFLILSAVFLTFIALKSDFDYSRQWGFTIKRLYGFAAVFWTLGAFAVFTDIYSHKLQNSKLIGSLIWLSVIVLIIINFANFDYIIYNTNKARTGQGEDLYYLSSLSTDSKSYKNQLNTLLKKNRSDEVHNSQAVSILLNKISNLQSKYKNPDFRTLNLSEYQTYIQTKDIDTEALKKVYFNQALKPRAYQLPVQSINNARTTIKVKGLPLALYDHHYDVFLKNGNYTITSGNLELDSFSHINGPGDFILKIYKYTSDAQNQNQAITQDIPFIIPNPAPANIEISFP